MITECQASLSFTNSQRLFKFMSIELVMPSNHLLLCHPLLLLPSVFSSIRVFSSRWPNEKKKSQNKTLPSETHISWIRHAVCLVNFSRPPSLLLLLWFYLTISSNGIHKWGSSAVIPSLILPFVGFILSWINSLLLETNEITYKENNMRQKNACLVGNRADLTSFQFGKWPKQII